MAPCSHRCARAQARGLDLFAACKHRAGEPVTGRWQAGGMRILVTGGAGFIGSHVVDAMAAGGHAVRVLDRLHPRAHTGRPAYLRDDVEYLDGGLDPDGLDRALGGVEAVCHQAAMVGLGRSFADAPDYVRDNDLGTAELLAAIHRRPVRARPARLEAGRFEPACPACGAELEPVPVTEDAPADPRNIYAATKLHQEHLAFASVREGGPAVTALRYHNVYGPRMPRDTPYAGVAAIFRSALERGDPPQVYEDGGQRRDFVHVTDVAGANVAALGTTTKTATTKTATTKTATTEAGGFAAYNIASGEPHTVGEMATALAEAFGGPSPVVTGGYRLGDVRHVVASPERARRELEFTAQVSFADGMREFAKAELRV